MSTIPASLPSESNFPGLPSQQPNSPDGITGASKAGGAGGSWGPVNGGSSRELPGAPFGDAKDRSWSEVWGRARAASVVVKAALTTTSNGHRKQPGMQRCTGTRSHHFDATLLSSI